MSGITEKIAREHILVEESASGGGLTGILCTCGVVLAGLSVATRHVAEVTEAAVQADVDAEHVEGSVLPTVDDLIDTRAGLALAKGAWSEGAAAVQRAAVSALGGEACWQSPVNPYSAPLLRVIKAEQGDDDLVTGARFIQHMPGCAERHGKREPCTPATVTPSREALRSLVEGAMLRAWTDEVEYATLPDALADALSVVLAGRSEAEARVDELRKAARDLDDPDLTTMDEFGEPVDWLNRRADAIERGGE